MKLLVTAFGPFAHFTSNPAQRLLMRLRERMGEDAATWMVLEVSFAAVDGFVETAPSGHDLHLHLGVATGALRPRLELTGRNMSRGRDVQGIERTSAPIIAGAPEALHTGLSADLIDGFLARFDGRLDRSHDAGDYLCNHLYFTSLLRQQGRSQVLFFHVADVDASPDAVPLDQQAEMIEALVARWREGLGRAA